MRERERFRWMIIFLCGLTLLITLVLDQIDSPYMWVSWSAGSALWLLWAYLYYHRHPREHIEEVEEAIQ